MPIHNAKFLETLKLYIVIILKETVIKMKNKLYFKKSFYNLLVKAGCLAKLEKLSLLIQHYLSDLKIYRYEQESGCKIKFVPQGSFKLSIIGNLKNFEIDSTSHVKSDTLIECSGGVKIGRYFHTGRGLTIFSTNHNYDSKELIPYDSTMLKKPVVIKDFVWLGANVTILPGSVIGEGSIVAGGSVVKGTVPDFAIVGGNPIRIIKYRNIHAFKLLRKEGKFF